jgi:putative glutamine amidotransferase
MLARSSAVLAASGAPLVGVTGPRMHAAEVATTPAILRHAWVDVHYAFYPHAVARAGGLPVHVAREADPAAIVGRLDALVVAGGQDVDPRAYGSQPTAGNTRLDPQRDAFEIGLVVAALEQDVPLLGICRGAQLINVALGGTLVEDLRAVQGIDHTLVLYPPDARVAMFLAVDVLQYDVVLASTLRGHKRVLEALRAGDAPAAGRAMAAHVRTTTRELDAILDAA